MAELSPLPKYSRVEYERRFLVDATAGWPESIKPYSKLFTDRYLAGGRLRLRRIEDSETGRVAFKLTKKYESDSAFAQPVVSVWLSPEEYNAFVAHPGFDLVKRRQYDERDHMVFSIDLFSGELGGLILCETEAESAEALANVTFPEYARCEVTEDSFFACGSLCRADQSQLADAVLRYRNIHR